MSVQTDSRLVKPGDTFVAVRGAASDGARFVPQAIAAGAARVVSEEAPPPDLPAGVAWERVPDSRAAAAALACEDAGHPSRRLSVVGVTGTNGKTTIANLVRRALEGCGVPCGLLSTIENDVHPLARSAPVTAHNTPAAASSRRASPPTSVAAANPSPRGISDSRLRGYWESCCF